MMLRQRVRTKAANKKYQVPYRLGSFRNFISSRKVDRHVKVAGIELIVNKEENSQMDFNSALLKVLEGRRITRISWDDKESFICLHSGFLRIFLSSDKMYHPWSISEVDLYARDWLVLAEN